MKLKKKAKRIIAIVSVLIIVVAALALYFFVIKKDAPKEAKVLKEIKEYGYVLKDNKNAKYKELFSELEKVLTADKVDEEKYATIISKMFIVDFYSLDEKLAKTDVGGIELVYKEARADFLENAENTIYKYVESNIYNQRKQDLPVVKEVTVKNIENDSFAFLEETDDNAFIVDAEWTYKDEKKAAGYQNKAKLVFAHTGKNLVLVELSNE